MESNQMLSVLAQIRSDLDGMGHAINDGRYADASEQIGLIISDLKAVKLALTSPVCMTQNPRQEPLGNAESKKYRQNDTDYPLFT